MASQITSHPVAGHTLTRASDTTARCLANPETDPSDSVKLHRQIRQATKRVPLQYRPRREMRLPSWGAPGQGLDGAPQPIFGGPTSRAAGLQADADVGSPLGAFSVLATLVPSAILALRAPYFSCSAY